MAKVFNEDFDFNGVTAPENKAFLKPGVYVLTVTGAKFERPEGKTPKLLVSLEGDAGTTTQTFYITPKTKNRLVYLHEQLFGKPMAKAFESAEAVGLYFEKCFEKIKPTKTFLIGGKEGTDGKIYAEFGYANFVVDENTPTGMFEEGSAQWISNIQRNVMAPKLATGAAVLPNVEVTGDADDLPF